MDGFKRHHASLRGLSNIDARTIAKLWNNYTYSFVIYSMLSNDSLRHKKLFMAPKGNIALGSPPVLWVLSSFELLESSPPFTP